MTTQALPQRPLQPRTRRATRAAHRRARPRVRPLAVFVLAVVLAFFAMIYSRISLDRTAFELQELDHEITQEQQLMDRLRVQTARRLDPIGITRRAEEMGLVFPDERLPLIVELELP